MAFFQLTDINFRTVSNPKALVEESDAIYKNNVELAASKIIENKGKSPVVFLSGPSGSGKTTTSMKIADELHRRGVGTHYVSMDDYYLPRGAEQPKTPDGEVDYESPKCIDMELISSHISALTKGERVYIPKYEFARGIRQVDPSKTIKLGSDEIVIFEGIHALNPAMTGAHPDAFKLYISARSDVLFEGRIVFKRAWFRLVRRLVRDYNFRGASALETMGMWANVCRGEELYIAPYKTNVDFTFNTAMPYEIPVFNHTATKLFMEVPNGVVHYEELRQVLPALQLFGDIDESLVAKDSLIREFIGGGVYEY